ncbi:MAG: thioredoxin domain-containing protein [Nitrospirae bacterium]|nr:thioredoxin domain-containing protein [Nitrospirota bacterium]
MIKGKYLLIMLLMLAVPLLMSGCVDKNKLDSIEQTQKDILAKLGQIEANQKSAPQVAQPASPAPTVDSGIEQMQKQILARLDKIEETQKNLAKAAQQATAPQRPPVDFDKVYNLPVGSSPVKGKKDARVTLVVFSDYQCPYCSKLEPTLNQVSAAYPNDVKMVFKDFPLSFHQHAKNAAKAARAAGEQGKFWEMHDLIFENNTRLSDDLYKELAAKLQLNEAKFLADFNSNKYDALIQQDIMLGQNSGVGGTPTLFMNGKRMQGRSFDDFKALIEGYIKK